METDVLIVGSGPAGGAAALALATYGVKATVITKYGWLADTPRAHITNQRTMEVLRDLGVEAEVVAKATPQALMGNNVFCTSLAGEELGRDGRVERLMALVEGVVVVAEVLAAEGRRGAADAAVADVTADVDSHGVSPLCVLTPHPLL